MKFPMALLLACAYSAAVSAQDTRPDLPLKSQTLLNPAPYIPPQCYTRTEDDKGNAHNPCYTCHTAPRRPNFTGDADLQLGYAFADLLTTNHWNNLFRDRSAAVAAIGDDEIRDYIRRSNYFDTDGGIVLQQRLGEVPRAWDFNGNGRWDGYIPDARFNFDAEGFDRSADGALTGWRAFAYYPFPGTFWPANGSTDDVLIRLPQAFRSSADGRPDLTVYKVNLAIVEAMLKERDVAIEPVDEAALGGIDLDRNGRIGTADRIAYDWAPLQDRLMWYVGAAYGLQKAGKLHLAAGLYPEGTEFLHTVRYIDVAPDGENRLAARMKEVRYARKRFWVDYSQLKMKAGDEVKEKRDFPDRLKTVRGNLEDGVSNGQAWIYSGFIEAADGSLRPQTYEELVFCVGCHGGIGGNRDGIFSFARKFDADAWRGGWYHPGQKSLRGIPDRRRADGQGEYARYLALNGAGDEFRENTEIRARFFDADGKLRPAELAALEQDITRLLYASERRAMTLNKAYRVIVREQGFTEGRDASVKPVHNVHERVDAGAATGIKEVEAAF